MSALRGRDQESGPDVYKTTSWLSAAGFALGVWTVILFRSFGGFLLAMVSVMMLMVLNEIAAKGNNAMATAPVTTKSTIVTTAEGDIKTFTDFASKFVVAHPKSAVIATAVVCLLLGLVFHI